MYAQPILQGIRVFCRTHLVQTWLFSHPVYELVRHDFCQVLYIFWSNVSLDVGKLVWQRQITIILCCVPGPRIGEREPNVEHEIRDGYQFWDPCNQFWEPSRKYFNTSLCMYWVAIYFLINWLELLGYYWLFETSILQILAFIK